MVEDVTNKYKPLYNKDCKTDQDTSIEFEEPVWISFSNYSDMHFVRYMRKDKKIYAVFARDGCLINKLPQYCECDMDMPYEEKHKDYSVEKCSFCGKLIRNSYKDSIKTIQKESIMDIFLLSRQEWDAIMAEVPNVPIETKGQWWLRSSGFDGCAAYVVNDGRAHNIGHKPNVPCGIRPAIKLTEKIGTAGEKALLNNNLCTFIELDVLLFDQILGYHIFDNKSCKYEESEIKKYINSESFKNSL